MLDAGTKLGEFEVLEALGEGAMGQVYRARGGDGEVVAVKVIAQGLAGDAAACQRFASESSILSDLNQPRIVAARTGLLREGERLFYAMEWVCGVDLGQALEADGALPPAKALSAVADVLEALGYAHARDVLHRDVKASNVLVEPSGRCKLSDFGLARTLAGTRVTRPGSVLYAVGALLHELLAGSPPFTGESALAVLNQHVSATPPPIEGAPAHVQAIVARALAKDPQERFESATEMRDAVLLSRARLEDAPPVAPPSGGERARLAQAETRELHDLSARDEAGSPASSDTATSLASPDDTSAPNRSPAAFATTIAPEGSSLADPPRSGDSTYVGAPEEGPQDAAAGWPAVVALLGVLLVVGGLAQRFGQSGPPPPPPRSPLAGATPAATPRASDTPTASTPAASATPAPSARAAPPPTRGTVKVVLRSGEEFSAELVGIDLERDELVTRVAGKERRDPLANVASYAR